MKNVKRMKEIAKEWIESKLLYCVFDCTDSMHSCEELEAKFEEYSSDDLADFVRSHPDLLKAYAAELCTERYKDEDFESTPCELPIPVSEVKHLMGKRVG